MYEQIGVDFRPEDRSEHFQAEAARVVQIFFDHIANAMAHGERVEIRAYAVFL